MSELERKEQRSLEQLCTQEEVNEKLVTAWLAGWMSRGMAEDERQQQSLEKEGLVN